MTAHIATPLYLAELLYRDKSGGGIDSVYTTIYDLFNEVLSWLLQLSYLIFYFLFTFNHVA